MSARQDWRTRSTASKSEEVEEYAPSPRRQDFFRDGMIVLVVAPASVTVLQSMSTASLLGEHRPHSNLTLQKVFRAFVTGTGEFALNVADNLSVGVAAGDCVV